MERIKLGTRKVSIEFPGVKALTDVDFEVTTGEIHALVGANGAGKSTLMKVLAGANPDYTGEVYLNGDTVELRSTLAAKKLGIQIVYQEVDMALIPTLSVAENVMLNDTVMHGKTIMNWRSLYKRAAEVLQRLNIDVDVHKLVQDLSLAQKQMVLIARAIVNECNFLILDEPTAPLSDTETEELFKLVKHLQATENIAIIFISHRINEILRICERYTVMRNGRVVDTTEITSQTTTREIVEKMLGRSFEENFPKEVAEIGEIIFELDHLSGADGMVNDVSLYARKGEIVGVAGLVGAGKSELCKTIFGEKPDRPGARGAPQRGRPGRRDSQLQHFGCLAGQLLHRFFHQQAKDRSVCGGLCSETGHLHAIRQAVCEKPLRRQPTESGRREMDGRGLRSLYF